VGHGANKAIFAKVFTLFQANPKKLIYLKCIIKYFPPEIVSQTVTTLIQTIKDCYQGDDRIQLVKEMGVQLIRQPPKKSQSKLDFLNFGWECMNAAKNPDVYMDCAVVLVEFAIKNMSSQAVNMFIREIFKKFGDFALSGTSDALFKKLEFLLVKVMVTAKDFSELIGFENLLGLLNYFSSSVKNKLCEMMLSFFVENHKQLQDGFLIHSIFTIAKTMHDKIDSMSEEAEIRRISALICKIIKKIDFGKDLDKTLNVYTTARGTFINLEEVTETLIYLTNRLATRAHSLVRGKHNQKTLSFVKACIAYSHITIPTLDSVEKQLNYFLQTAEVALLNGLISETDSLLKGILATIDENWEALRNKQYVADLLSNVLGFLVVVPSNPETSYFQLMEGVLTIIKDREWPQGSEQMRVRLYLNGISYLSTQMQHTLPYTLANVDSNDKIFIGNDDFTREGNQLMDFLFDQVLDIVSKLNEVKSHNLVALHEICLMAANTLVAHCQLTKKVENFINKLFKMADGYVTEYNQVHADKKSKAYITKTYEAFKKKKDQQGPATKQESQQEAPRAASSGQRVMMTS